MAGALVLVIGGSIFALGMAGGGDGGQRPNVEKPHPAPEEREMQRIKIAASEVTLEEAAKTPDGWVVRVSKESKGLDVKKMAEDAATFFEDLARAEVEIAAASFVVRTNELKDVWGNRLKDVSLLRIGLDKATFGKINWRGFDPLNFPRVTEDFWMHDLVAEKWREEQQKSGDQGGGAGGSQSGGGQGDPGQGGGAGV